MSGDEDKLREAPAAAVPPAVAEVLGSSVKKVNSEMTGTAGAELVTLEAAMAVTAVGADKKGGKRRLAPAVMLGLLGASLLGACAPAVVEPQAGVVTIQAAQSTEVQGAVIVPTEEPTRPPEAVASLTPKVVGMMAESPNKSGWLPPTTEDTILTNQTTGGELPPQLQPLIDQAQATIAVTGFAQARVETVTNGQAGDAFRAAFVFRVPEGVIWAQGSAYPSQLNPDGSVSQSHAYVLVPGSADARIEWTPGADGSPDTETTLVKHTANLPDDRQAALLYWHTTEQTWKPIGGYPTAQEFVAVGDTVYQFSPEDGSAVEIGTIAALQSLSTNNGRVEATDASGQVFWFEEGRFVNEALLAAEASAAEARRVAEYVEANTEPINRVEMPLLEFRASDRLQEAIWDRLPDDVQALGDKPLYMMVYDVEKLTEVIGSLSIYVAGHEDKVSLADKKVVFTFLSGREEIPEVFLPYYVANQSDGYRYGAFEGSDGEINIVIELASSVSFTYKYDSFHEWQIMSEGVVLGLNQLSGNQDRDVVRFGKRFYIDTPYDDFSHPEDTRGITWLMHPSVGYGLRHELNSGYLSPGYYKKMGEWIPEEYRGQIPGLEQ